MTCCPRRQLDLCKKILQIELMHKMSPPPSPFVGKACFGRMFSCLLALQYSRKGENHPVFAVGMTAGPSCCGTDKQAQQMVL